MTSREVAPTITLRAGMITCKGFRQLLEAWTNDGSPHEYRAGALMLSEIHSDSEMEVGSGVEGAESSSDEGMSSE